MMHAPLASDHNFKQTCQAAVLGLAETVIAWHKKESRNFDVISFTQMELRLQDALRDSMRLMMSFDMLRDVLLINRLHVQMQVK